MPAIDFPNTPTAGQTFSVGYQTWSYDGAVWRLVPTSTVSTFSRVACNSNTTTTTVDALVTNATTALNLTSGDKAFIVGTYDISFNAATANSTFNGTLYAGPTGSTVAQAGQAVAIGVAPTAGDRFIISQSWIYTVPTTGSYTFQLFCKHTNGAFTVYTPNTTLSVMALR